MKRSIIETALGALVLFIAGTFLIFSYKTADVEKVSGYKIFANFSGVGGLNPGDKVVISGVKIGSVLKIELNENYLARVTLGVENHIQLPLDTAAVISSESLLGGRYMELIPGAEEDFLEEGDNIDLTQPPQNLEQLLGKFIFSMQSDDAAK